MSQMTRNMKLILAILGVSLMLNVFALGLYIGKGFRHPSPHKMMMRPSLDFNLKKIERHLDPESRKKVKVLLKKQHHELRKRYRDLGALEKEIKATISAETVDKEALVAALAELSEQKQKLHSPRREVILQVIAELDLETRKVLAESMFRKRGWKKKHMRPRDFRRDCAPGDRQKSEVSSAETKPCSKAMDSQ